MVLHGDMIYEDASLGPAALPVGSTGQVLTVVAGQPAWANASTGFTNPMTTHGDMIYEDASLGATALPIGTTGQVLTVAGGQPAWADSAGGGLSTAGPRFGNFYSARIGATNALTLYSVGCQATTLAGNGINVQVAASGTVPLYVALKTGASNAETGQASWEFSSGSTTQTITVGTFRAYSTYAGLLQTTASRVLLGVTDIIPGSTITLRGTDTPAANLIAFEYSTDLSETTWQCVVRDASTTTKVDSTVSADTNFHLFTITYDGANAKFYIDGTLKATIAVGATGFPTSTVAIDGMAYVNCTTNTESVLGVSWMYMEGL
jgi:hypothetical protein